MEDAYIIVSKFTLNSETFYKILSVWDDYALALEEAEKLEEKGYINVTVQCWVVHGKGD